MIEITLPDGSVRQFGQSVTVHDVAKAIGKGLARATLAGEVDGELVDGSWLMGLGGWFLVDGSWLMVISRSGLQGQGSLCALDPEGVRGTVRGNRQGSTDFSLVPSGPKRS